MEASDNPSPEYTRVLGLLLVDDEFRDTFYADPDSALGGYGLSDEDRMYLNGIPRDVLNKTVEQFRAGTSVVGVTAAIGGWIKGTFDTDAAGRAPGELPT